MLACIFANGVGAQGGQGGFLVIPGKSSRKELYGDLPNNPEFPPCLPSPACANGNHHRAQPAKTLFKDRL